MAIVAVPEAIHSLIAPGVTAAALITGLAERFPESTASTGCFLLLGRRAELVAQDITVQEVSDQAPGTAVWPQPILAQVGEELNIIWLSRVT